MDSGRAPHRRGRARLPGGARAGARRGVRRIGIVDDDRVDASNLHRQVLFADADVGELKAVALARALSRRFPALDVVAHAVRFDVGNARELVAGVRRGHRRLGQLRDQVPGQRRGGAGAAAAGPRRPRSGPGGQLVTVPAGGRPCYRCLFEEPPPPGVGPSCAEAGVLGPVPGVIGALAGVEACAAAARRKLPLSSGASSSMIRAA